MDGFLHTVGDAIAESLGTNCLLRRHWDTMLLLGTRPSALPSEEPDWLDMDVPYLFFHRYTECHHAPDDMDYRFLRHLHPSRAPTVSKYPLGSMHAVQSFAYWERIWVILGWQLAKNTLVALNVALAETVSSDALKLVQHIKPLLTLSRVHPMDLVHACALPVTNSNAQAELCCAMARAMGRFSYTDSEHLQVVLAFMDDRDDWDPLYLAELRGLLKERGVTGRLHLPPWQTLVALHQHAGGNLPFAFFDWCLKVAAKDDDREGFRAIINLMDDPPFYLRFFHAPTVLFDMKHHPDPTARSILNHLYNLQIHYQAEDLYIDHVLQNMETLSWHSEDSQDLYEYMDEGLPSGEMGVFYCGDDHDDFW